MTTCSASVHVCRMAGYALAAAAVIALSGCIPVDNTFLRTSLYVMALERASHGGMQASRITVQRDDCERHDQLYFMCRYPGLTAFLSPAAGGVYTTGRHTSAPDLATAPTDIQADAGGDRIASAATPAPAAGGALALRAGAGNNVR